LKAFFFAAYTQNARPQVNKRNGDLSTSKRDASIDEFSVGRDESANAPARHPLIISAFVLVKIGLLPPQKAHNRLVQPQNHAPIWQSSHQSP
jgi:hypothetical protein